MHIIALLYAGNNLDKAREIFVTTVRHRPGIELTIRQRTRVLQQWLVIRKDGYAQHRLRDHQ